MIIAIEGVDQAGKQTQSAMLQDALTGRGLSVKTLHFPMYKTPTGKIIQQYLASRGQSTAARVPPKFLHCMQAANKWESLYAIEEAAEDHDIVVMDRYTGSNIAYGVANGMSRTWLERLEAGLPRAAHTILLDIPVGSSFSRRPQRRDTFERNREFLEAVRDTYLEMARKKGWIIIGAGKPEDAVHQNIMKKLMPRIRRTAGRKTKKKKTGAANTQQESEKKAGR